MPRKEDDKHLGSFHPDQDPIPESREQTLASTLDYLWNVATTNFGGSTTRVDRGSPQQPDLEALELNLNRLISEGDVKEWKSLTEDTLVEPQKDFRGVSIREGNIRPQRIEVPIAGGIETFKYSYVTAIADHKPQSDNMYPPDPYKGRPQIKITALDIFTDSRRALTQLYERMIGRNKSAADEINQRVRTAVIGVPEVQSDQLIKPAIEELEQTPLTAIGVIARKTYFDSEKSEWQPVNAAGYVFTDDLSHQLTVSRLEPSKGHNRWEALPADDQFRVAVKYDDDIYPVLDNNLRRLARFISKK